MRKASVFFFLFWTDLAHFGLNDQDHSILTILAKPGMGKSALMAKLALVLKQV